MGIHTKARESLLVPRENLLVLCYEFDFSETYSLLVPRYVSWFDVVSSIVMDDICIELLFI